jgi:hypothetical protein
MSSANLTPASGRQDHTTSPSAKSTIRPWHHRVHRIPCPTFVTIAKRPLCVGRDASDVEVIWVKREPEYFCEGGWTAKPLICPSCKISRPSGRILCAKLVKCSVTAVPLCAAQVPSLRLKVTDFSIIPSCKIHSNLHFVPGGSNQKTKWASTGNGGLRFEAEQEFVCRQRWGNFFAVCQPGHVKISASVQCGSKIENRLLPALSTSEFLLSLVGQNQRPQRERQMRRGTRPDVCAGRLVKCTGLHPISETR